MRSGPRRRVEIDDPNGAVVAAAAAAAIIVEHNINTILSSKNKMVRIGVWRLRWWFFSLVGWLVGWQWIDLVVCSGPNMMMIYRVNIFANPPAIIIIYIGCCWCRQTTIRSVDDESKQYYKIKLMWSCRRGLTLPLLLPAIRRRTDRTELTENGTEQIRSYTTLWVHTERRPNSAVHKTHLHSWLRSGCCCKNRARWWLICNLYFPKRRRRQLLRLFQYNMYHYSCTLCAYVCVFNVPGQLSIVKCLR